MQLSKYKTKDKCADYAITNGRNATKNSCNKLRTFLQEYDLIANKHIPSIFRINSRLNRLKLLAGLIDTDGHRSTSKGKENVCEMSFSKEVFAREILDLAQSLGFR
jgi:replicative DNA helicase